MQSSSSSNKNNKFFFAIWLVLLLLVPLLHVVRAQDEGDGDDHDDHDHEHSDPAVVIIQTFDLDNDTYLSEEEFDALYDTLFPDAHHEHEHEHEGEHDGNETDAHGDEDDHDDVRRFAAQQRVRSRQTRKTSNRNSFIRAAGIVLAERQLHQRQQRNNKRQAVVSECHPADELFAEFDADGNGLLNETEVEAMTPELLMMIIQESCVEHGHEESDECEESESWEAWLSTIASVIIVTVITLVGIIFVPFLAKWPKLHVRVIMVMISFASGALIGDAVYHLILQAVELHAHAPGESHDHAQEEEEGDDDDKDYLGPLTLVIVGILTFYIIEALLFWALGTGHSHSEDIQHIAKDKSSSDEESKDDDTEHDIEMSEKSEDSSDGSQSPVFKGGFKGSIIKIRDGAKNQAKRLQFVKTFGWLNLVADAFHNFIDGIAIGVAYSNSLALGLSTTIAVGLHEIPQELGDYGILINAGFSPLFALLFNLFSGSLSILGGIIGVAVGDNASDADKWILAFTAGGFLYIAMVNMFSEMHKSTRIKSWWGLLDISLQIFAMLVGFAILVVLAVYEDDIKDC